MLLLPGRRRARREGGGGQVGVILAMAGLVSCAATTSPSVFFYLFYMCVHAGCSASTAEPSLATSATPAPRRQPVVSTVLPPPFLAASPGLADRLSSSPSPLGRPRAGRQASTRGPARIRLASGPPRDRVPFFRGPVSPGRHIAAGSILISPSNHTDPRQDLALPCAVPGCWTCGPLHGVDRGALPATPHPSAEK